MEEVVKHFGTVAKADRLKIFVKTHLGCSAQLAIQTDEEVI